MRNSPIIQPHDKIISAYRHQSKLLISLLICVFRCIARDNVLAVIRVYLLKCLIARCVLAHIMHFFRQFSQLFLRLWLILQDLIYINPCLTCQYFLTFLTTPVNQRLLAKSRFTSYLQLTIITIADPRLFFVFCCSCKQFSIITHQGIVFNKMTVEDSIFFFKSSNFFSLKYHFNDIT